MQEKEKKGNSVQTFSRYQVFIITILSILQFTVVLDFMVLSPLGAILLDELNINTAQFGLVVSAYAFSAGISGILAAGFADKFDRKKLLMFFYTGFIAGTLFCGLAPTYDILLLARVITGLFGGVLSSIGLAIITDMFPMEQRGRVMGFVQMAFAASQVLGIPIGLVLANQYGWHSPFLMIVVFSLFVALAVAMYMKPVKTHLLEKSEKNALNHLLSIIRNKEYISAFLGTTLLATGGFMLMPFASAFCTNNLGLSNEQLPVLYAVTGIFTMVLGPLAGKLSDSIGKYNMFIWGSFLAGIMVIIYTNMTITPLWMVIVVNVLLFAGVTARIISASALITGIPDIRDRGAFMSINSSVQQLSGGIASAIAGIMVYRRPSGMLDGYDILGYTVVVTMIITLFLYLKINRILTGKKVVRPQP